MHRNKHRFHMFQMFDILCWKHPLVLFVFHRHSNAELWALSYIDFHISVTAMVLQCQTSTVYLPQKDVLYVVFHVTFNLSVLSLWIFSDPKVWLKSRATFYDSLNERIQTPEKEGELELFVFLLIKANPCQIKCFILFCVVPSCLCQFSDPPS